MNTIETHEISFEDYVDNVAASTLTDEQYHEFQGLFINDRLRYLTAVTNKIENMPENREWYFLDPDNNKESPDGLHCCRCKRKVKDQQAVVSFRSVEMHPEHPWVRNAALTGRYLIGEDCWKKITKDGPVKP